MQQICESIVLYDINLNSFDGEGAGAPAGGDTGTGSNGGVASTGTQEVIYGKVETENVDTQSIDNQNASDNTPDPATKFEELIKGEFKDQFDKRVQDIINRRFKDNKQLESRLGQVEPMVDLLMEKYGAKSTEELFAKIETESIEELAYQNNMTPEQYKRMKELEKKANLYDNTITQQDEQRMMNDKIDSWYKQADEMTEQYPDFNLQEWAQNDEFMKLINANIPVKQAYELLNLDNIKSNVAKTAQENTVKNIQAQKNRPKESATNSSTGAVIKSDVKSLTKADREEIARRAQRGEMIRF